MTLGIEEPSPALGELTVHSGKHLGQNAWDVCATQRECIASRRLCECRGDLPEMVMG